MFMFHECSCFFPWPWGIFVFRLFVVQVQLQLQQVWAGLCQSLPKRLVPALPLLTGGDQGSRWAGSVQGSSLLRGVVAPQGQSMTERAG